MQKDDMGGTTDTGLLLTKNGYEANYKMVASFHEVISNVTTYTLLNKHSETLSAQNGERPHYVCVLKYLRMV